MNSSVAYIAWAGSAAACFLLGAWAAFRYGRKRHADRLDAELAEALGRLTGLLKRAEDTQDFTVRSDNPNLAPCWQTQACENTACVAYENADLRCWHMPGTLCPGPGERADGDGPATCEQCTVYQQARPDLASELTERFNDVMARLREEAEELVEAKRHVFRANKLASVGEFAAGIAHEINNPLDGVLSCVARLERDPANLTQNMEYLRLMHDGLKRMSRVIQRLLEFSQTRDLHFAAEDIHAVIENVAALVRTSVRQRAVTFEFDFGEDVPPIMGDKYYLGQAFLNLTLNALTATAEGGTVTFRTRASGALREGRRFVEAAVTDDGIGVEPANLDKIFDPFFTTKEPGKGTGLGLAIVKSIIDEHDGSITVESRLGEGTTIRVFLPVADEKGVPLATDGEVASL